MWFQLIVFLSSIIDIGDSFYKQQSVLSVYSPLTKISICNETKTLYIGGKNLLLQMDYELVEYERDILGPVNNSKLCKPFDTACIFQNQFKSTDNEISILLPFKWKTNGELLVCGTAHQGLCYMYNPRNVSIKRSFSLEKHRQDGDEHRNFLGSGNSSVMHVTTHHDGYQLFFVGQSYDGRDQKFFYKEFATLNLYKVHSSWFFDHNSAMSFLSICDLKKTDFRIKFLYIFEADGFIFHVFIRSEGNRYDTRITRLCKDEDDYGSYEETTIYCKTTKDRYNIGLSAFFSGGKLYMTFGVGYTSISDDFDVDQTQGSALCIYSISDITMKFDHEVLSECFQGKFGSPSWQCNITSCPVADMDYRKTARFTACNQTLMKNGIESNGDGISEIAVYDIRGELMTSIASIRHNSAHIVATGSNTGFLRKILIEQDQGREFVKFDVSRDRTVPIGMEMVLDTDKNLYMLSGNMVTKLPLLSCRFHSSCGDCVLSGDPLGCGWCGDHCSTKRECISSLWHENSCPPVVISATPVTGPTDGGTILTINGENFGWTLNNSRVMVNATICTIENINDTCIICRTNKMSLTFVRDIIKVNVVDVSSKNYKINGSSEQTNVTFTYMEPEVFNFYPVKGPLSGKTSVTVSGKNLNIGSSVSVHIGPVSCDILSISEDKISCRTTSCRNCPKIHSDGEHKQDCFDLEVRIDGGTYNATESFCYRPDPIIRNQLIRNTTIVSGGLDVVINGEWFDSVSDHSLRTSVDGFLVTTPCHVETFGFKMICKSPDLSGNDDLTAIGMKGINAQMSVLLDNNTVYSANTTVFPDPELNFLDKSSQISHIDINTRILELKGRYLNMSLRKEDITLTINGTSCPVVELGLTILKCDLYDILHQKDIPLPVEASAGNWNIHVGHIRFEHVRLGVMQMHTIIAGTCVGLFIILIFFICVIMKKKHVAIFKKKHFTIPPVEYHSNPESENFLATPETSADESGGVQRYVRQQQNMRAGSQISEGATNGIPQTGFDAYQTCEMLKTQNIYIERERVRLGKDIGHGNFGCVYKGYLRSTIGQEELDVAVKTVLKAGSQDINAFLDEAIIMKDFDHPNVLSLIGISVAPGEFPLVILPFMANGDLLSYIRNESNNPTVKDLVRFGLDVSRGMEYLGLIKFVHRDLAARNCMLDDKLRVKVADFGLARDIYTKNYYSSDNKKMLPVKWMAPESLENGTYSTKSDVWSYGIVFWELMTRGAAPYSDVDNWDMLKYLESGRCLKRPNFCPMPLYDIMLKCWDLEPENRPTFQYISQRITELVDN